jgi:SAM-dependent methyltransferase
LKTDFDGAGNLYNKYESENPVVQALVKKFFSDLESVLVPIKGTITSAFEIGCGEGYITGFIDQMGIPIIGADVSPRIVEIARRNYPGINFSVLSIYDLHTISTTYDMVVANEVLEHLSNPDEAMKEIKKIARKYILISVPNEPFFRLANIVRLKYLKDAGNTPGHVNHWSKRTFGLFLNRHGLKIREIKCSTLWTIVLCEVPFNVTHTIASS